MEVLDKIEAVHNTAKKPILSFGIGVFIYIATSAFAYVFYIVVRDILIGWEWKSTVILLVSESIELILVLLAILYAVHKVKLASINLRIYISVAIGLLVLGYALQVLYGFLGQEIFGSEHYEKLSDYYIDLETPAYNGFISPVFDLLKYGGIVLIILLKK